MDKYFDKNRFRDASLSSLCDELFDATKVLYGNLMVNDIEGSLKRGIVRDKHAKFEENTAIAALYMIGICEAVMSKLDPEAVEAAGEDAEREFAKDPENELGDLLRTLLGFE